MTNVRLSPAASVSGIKSATATRNIESPFAAVRRGCGGFLPGNLVLPGPGQGVFPTSQSVGVERHGFVARYVGGDGSQLGDPVIDALTIGRAHTGKEMPERQRVPRAGIGQDGVERIGLQR